MNNENEPRSIDEHYAEITQRQMHLDIKEHSLNELQGKLYKIHDSLDERTKIHDFLDARTRDVEIREKLLLSLEAKFFNTSKNQLSVTHWLTAIIALNLILFIIALMFNN